MLWKCCTQSASKFGKLSSGHRTQKGQFSFQPQRKSMPKNVQTTTQLYSSYILQSNAQNFSSQPSTVYEPWISRLKLYLEKAEEPDIKLSTSVESSKKQEFQKNIYFYAKAFDYVDHNKLWTIITEMKIPDYLTCLPKSVCRSISKVRTVCGTTDWFQIGKGVHQRWILSPCLFNFYVYVTCHAKCWAGWSTSWNQDLQERYQ